MEDKSTDREYLKMLGAGDTQVSDMLGEPLPPTETMKKYMELDATYKDLEKQHKALRKEVIEEFSSNPGKVFEGINKSVSQRIDFQHLEFYNWVAETFPEHLEELKDSRIDYDAFESLEARGVIEYDELPEHVYRILDITRITVKRKRNNK